MGEAHLPGIGEKTVELAYCWVCAESPDLCQSVTNNFKRNFKLEESGRSRTVMPPS
jgi:hypothetical protein